MTFTTTKLTLRGPLKQEEELCQDVAHAEIPSPGLCILIVADGAGSRTHSAEGAQTVVESLTEAIHTGHDQMTPGPSAQELRAWTKQAFHQGIEKATQRLGSANIQLDEYAATVGLAVCRPPDHALCALGDVWACVQRTTSEHCLLIVPPDRNHLQRSATTDGGTIFFTTAGWKEELYTTAVNDPDIRAVFLSTDGLEDVAIGYHTSETNRTYPRDVYLVPEIFDSVRSGTTSTALSQDLASESIQGVKGDDIGFALACW